MEISIRESRDLDLSYGPEFPVPPVHSGTVQILLDFEQERDFDAKVSRHGDPNGENAKEINIVSTTGHNESAVDEYKYRKCAVRKKNKEFICENTTAACSHLDWAGLDGMPFFQFDQDY